jgi:hypothetical protein
LKDNMLAVLIVFFLAITAYARPVVVTAEDCDNGIGRVRELAVSQDGRFVAALRHDACLWRSKDGRRIKQFDFAQPLFLAGGLLFLGEKTFDPLNPGTISSNKAPHYDSESTDVFALIGPTSIAIKNNEQQVLIYDWKTKLTQAFPGTWKALSKNFVVDWDGWEEDRPLTIRWASILAPSQHGSFRLSRKGRAQLIGMGNDMAIFNYGSDNVIDIWKLPEGRRVAVLPAGTNETLGIASNGKTMATYENLGPKGKDNEYRIVIWNVRPLKKTLQVRVKLSGLPHDFRFDDAAKTLVICDENGACVFLHLP